MGKGLSAPADVPSTPPGEGSIPHLQGPGQHLELERGALAKIGQILAAITGLVIFVIGIIAVIAAETLPYVEEFPSPVEVDLFYRGIISLLLGLVIILFEFDKIVITNHIVRGLIYIVMILIEPMGLLLIIAAICYLIAGIT